MTIRWSSEQVGRALYRLTSSQDEMNQCLNEARAAQTALIDARPDEDAEVMTRLLEEYAETLSSMEASARELADLIQASRRARTEMDEAAEAVDDMIDRLMVGVTGAGKTSHWSNRSHVAARTYPLPKPFVLPYNYNPRGRLVSPWLERPMRGLSR